MNVKLTIIMGLFLPMQFDVHISDRPQMANPMNAETLINMEHACPAMCCTCVGDITFFTNKRIFNASTAP
jgi:hypothetical protein